MFKRIAFIISLLTLFTFAAVPAHAGEGVILDDNNCYYTFDLYELHPLSEEETEGFQEYEIGELVEEDTIVVPFMTHDGDLSEFALDINGMFHTPHEYGYKMPTLTDNLPFMDSLTDTNGYAVLENVDGPFWIESPAGGYHTYSLYIYIEDTPVLAHPSGTTGCISPQSWVWPSAGTE